MAVYAGLYGPTGIEFPNGQHAANQQYTVLNSSGNPISLYLNKNRGGSKPNPGFTDQYGNVTFFANPGEYVLQVGEDFQMPIVVGLHPDEPIEGGGGGPGGPLDFQEPITIPTTTTDIFHNLGFDPSGVICKKTGGSQVYPRITYLEEGVSLRLNFPGNFTGTVFLS